MTTNFCQLLTIIIDRLSKSKIYVYDMFERLKRDRYYQNEPMDVEDMWSKIYPAKAK